MQARRDQERDDIGDGDDMRKFFSSILIAQILISLSLTARAETLGQIPDSSTIWVPITLNLEIDEIRLRFGAPNLRQNAFTNIAVTEIIEKSYTSKQACEFSLMEICKADNCDVESLSVGNTEQYVFRNFFPKRSEGRGTAYAIFAFCRPYQIFFEGQHEIFRTGF